MERKLSFTIKVARPVCRTPIKPMQKHKISTRFSRKEKHPQRGMSYE